MIDHDRLFKELLTTFFREFLDCFFPHIANALDPNFIRYTVELLDQKILEFNFPAIQLNCLN